MLQTLNYLCEREKEKKKGSSAERINTFSIYNNDNHKGPEGLVRTFPLINLERETLETMATVFSLHSLASPCETRSAARGKAERTQEALLPCR